MKKKILFVSSEVAPFAKTGGLADVAGALPMALENLGMDVRVAMPGHAANHYGKETPVPVLPRLHVQVGSRTHATSVSSVTMPHSGVPVYFINNPEFFDRPGLYQEGGLDYPDNAERFAFFCKAVIWMVKGLNWIPDVIHCNDWQTGLLPVMLKTDADMLRDPELQSIRTVLTIHNLAYQGLFPPAAMAAIGLSPTLFHPGAMEFYGSVNLLKGGLLTADTLTTVSPTYAREIQTKEFGAGLEGVLRDRAADLHGILNGIDYGQWNPETDTYLEAGYSPEDLSGKTKCKTNLQTELGLKPEPRTPLMVMISRLDPQKGLDILLPLLPELMKRDVQVAVLGTGLPEYHEALTAAAQAHPGQMAVVLKFDNGLAHRMEAGGDLFLMPSRFEPCGLNQLYSLRYGTLPVVRRTGGLADSVEQVSDNGQSGTGFVFDKYTGAALLTAIDEALQMFKKVPTWESTQRRAMAKDFSWTASAKLYADLYETLLP